MSGKDIPFVAGDFVLIDQPAVANSMLTPTNDAQEGGPSLSPGRWMISPKTTVPFVKIQVPHRGTRYASWGETVELEPKQTCQIANGSYHDGDIVLTGAGTGSGMNGARPATVAIPAMPYVATNGRLTTRWIDVRLARRAFLVFVGNNANAALHYVVYHDAVERGKVTNPQGTTAANQGMVLQALTAFGFLQWLPLGLGAVMNLDTLGRSLPELRPMGFLTRLYVDFTFENETTPAGLTSATDLYYVLEY